MAIRKDLTGQKFGRLLVISQAENRNNKIFWNCKCDCGKEKEVESYKLLSGHTQSCGCIRENIGKKLRLDLTGERSGKLVAVEITDTCNSGIYWRCKCDCGNETIVSATRFHRGVIQSCGCLAKEIASQTHLKDLTGMRFNMLTVISRVDNNGNKTRWKCLCDCGNECICYSDCLLNANQYSCGCKKISKGEARIKEILEKYNINFIPQYKFDDLRGIGDGKLSYDFYLPKENILIEYQGALHDTVSGYLGGEERLERQKVHDNLKRQYAKNNNYDLLEIWHYDYDNIETILCRKLNLIEGE